MNTTRIRSIGLGAVLALGLTACSFGSGTDTGAAAPEPSLGTVSHVHGLGVDPSDRRLYVATHDGLFVVGQNGAAEPAGPSHHDFMGFTVAGPKRFLASGHPASGAEGPGDLGLIESTDGGKTWKPRSLAGEVDFHALDHAHGTVYGYDSTNALLRVSEDGVTWDDRARLQALDIAVDPENPDTVLATTADGIARSTDGGRTFAEGEPPAMAFLSWPGADALYGIGDSGELSRSADGGTTWQPAGTVPGGQVQALTAVDAQHVLAATESGVYESRDGGKSFTKRLVVHAGDGH
ncbi:F510_1955 family glycosylhydrolase [Streptomyces sp. NPDC047928]|uniref:F510_1955 family glycosylhydrolase n=1 Tax=unclassified Streptomyces TaxID=2593676 RepID=UPI00371A5E01